MEGGDLGVGWGAQVMQWGCGAEGWGCGAAGWGVGRGLWGRGMGHWHGAGDRGSGPGTMGQGWEPWGRVGVHGAGLWGRGLWGRAVCVHRLLGGRRAGTGHPCSPTWLSTSSCPRSTRTWRCSEWGGGQRGRGGGDTHRTYSGSVGRGTHTTPRCPTPPSPQARGQGHAGGRLQRGLVEGQGGVWGVVGHAGVAAGALGLVAGGTQWGGRGSPWGWWPRVAPLPAGCVHWCSECGGVSAAARPRRRGRWATGWASSRPTSCSASVPGRASGGAAGPCRATGSRDA